MRIFRIGTLLFTVLFIIKCTPQPSSSSNSQGLASSGAVKKLLFEDNVYEDRIKTVLFYPSGSSATSVLNPPIVNRAQPVPLILEFDDLGKDYCNYYVKLFHCNANWTRSNYTDLQFAPDYNEYLIQDYSPSINTKIRFTHFRFAVPKVKITGNYLLIVYRNGNVDDVVISKKYIVYDPIVEILPNVQIATDVADRDTKQQVDFTIAYGQYEIVNPQDVKVLVRQNHRWDNALQLSQPMYIKFDKKQLDYTFFDGSNRFWGGNEFRYFDIRNLRIKGMNVETYATTDTNNTVKLVQDRNRNSLTYSELIDINGKFVIQRAEASDPGTEGDYAAVQFSLKVAADFEGDIYLAGQLTDWKIKPSFKMDYSSETGLYTKTLLLKQGFYNYQYILLNKNSLERNYFEGNYSLTENIYDIIVYYRPANQFNDIVIGYKSINYRGRN